MKLLAFGDLHLGAGTALGREPGDRLRDQEQVLERIIALAGVRQVDAILMAGDLFEGPGITPEQLDSFMRAFEQLEGSIPMIAISGNGRHDLAMRHVNALQPLRHVPGVHVYSRPAIFDFAQVAIACLPWVSPARLVASMNGDVDRDAVNAHAARLLVKVADELCDTRIKPTVLLLHGSLSGASLPTGISTDELREAVLPVDELLELGYAAVVASHIHVPQYLRHDFGDLWLQPVHDPRGICAVDGVAAFYTGSPMPLNFGETSVPHGVWILDIDAGQTHAEFVPIESRPLRQTILDLAALETDQIDPVSEFDGILDANAWPDVDDAIVKVTLRATQAQQRRLDLGRLREAILAAGAHTVKIDVDSVREQRARVDGVTEELDPLEAFDAWSAANDVVAAAASPARDRMEADLEQVGA
jgi:DNA repair exonuclease SbcCD nuclease subunit